MNKFEFNNFSYYDIPHDDVNYINVKHSQEKPKNLYKFYGLNKNSIDCLTENYFYAPHSLALNDILDGSLFFLKASKPIPFHFYQSFYKNQLDEKSLFEFYKKDIETNSSGYINFYWERLSNKLGIISTTSKEDNILMWPHYTNERGFQLKFKTKNIEESIKNKIPGKYFGLFPVNYCDELAQLDLIKINSIFIPMLYCSTVKSRLWDYENEWRFIISNPNMGIPFTKSGFDPREDKPQKNNSRRIYYDAKLVEGITFGSNFIIGEDFIIDRLRFNGRLTGKSIVQVKDRKENTQLNIKLLDYCSEFLSDRVFLSSHDIKKEGEKGAITRTKKRVIIKKESQNRYLFELTNDMRKL